MAKECEIGYSCGDTCIERVDNCRSGIIGKAWGALLDRIVKLFPRRANSTVTSGDSGFVVSTDKRKIARDMKSFDPAIQKIFHEARKIDTVREKLNSMRSSSGSQSWEKSRLTEQLKLSDADILKERPENSKIPPDQYVRVYRGKTQRQLEEVIAREAVQEQRIANLEKAQTDIESKYDPAQMNASYQIYLALREEVAKRGSKVLGIYDKNGNLQSLAEYKEKRGVIYVDYLMTAPWNILPQHQNKVKGAGRAVISGLAKRGKEIQLSALSSAKPFYEKIGFKESETGVMILSKQDGQKL